MSVVAISNSVLPSPFARRLRAQHSGRFLVGGAGRSRIGSNFIGPGEHCGSPSAFKTFRNHKRFDDSQCRSIFQSWFGFASAS